MSLTLEGLDELLRDLDGLAQLEKQQITKNAVQKASEIMLDELKLEAPKARANSKSSYQHLNNTITQSDGGTQAKMGIDASNWSRTKGLWFHYFGFRGHEPDDWVDRAFDRSKEKAMDAIREELAESINR